MGIEDDVRRYLLAGCLAVATACAGAVLPISAVSVSAAAAVAAPGEPVRVMVLGDSVAHGSTGDYTWRYRLWQHLVADGVAVDLVGPNDGLHDLATDGQDNQDYAVAGFDRDHAARWGMAAAAMDHPVGELVSDFAPDVLVEELGLNDLVFWGLSPDRVLGELADIVAAARESDPTIDVVLGALPQEWVPGVRELNAGLGDLAARLDEPTSRVVATAVPGFAIATDTWDTSHPTATGEVKIAAVVADALARVGVGAAYPRPLPVVANGPSRTAVLRAAPGRRSLVLRWIDPPGATSERVWLRDASTGGRWATRGEPTTTAESSRRLRGLAPGHVYVVRLQAAKGTAISPRYSPAVRVRIDGRARSGHRA